MQLPYHGDADAVIRELPGISADAGDLCPMTAGPLSPARVSRRPRSTPLSRRHSTAASVSEGAGSSSGTPSSVSCRRSVSTTGFGVGPQRRARQAAVVAHQVERGLEGRHAVQAADGARQRRQPPLQRAGLVEPPGADQVADLGAQWSGTTPANARIAPCAPVTSPEK